MGHKYENMLGNISSPLKQFSKLAMCYRDQH